MPQLELKDLLRLRRPGVRVDSEGGQYSVSTIAISRRNYIDSGSGKLSAPTDTSVSHQRA